MCWTQGRFIVNHPEGLTLTEFLRQRIEQTYARPLCRFKAFKACVSILWSAILLSKEVQLAQSS